MSYEEELEALQQEAMDEIEGDDDGANTDDDQQEESISESNDDGEAENDREDTSGDEREDDPEDDEELEDEEEDLSDDDDDTAGDTDIVDEEDSTDFEPLEVNINGQNISLNSMDEVKQFLSKKNDVQAKHRKSQSEQILEQGKISESDLALLIDAKKGNKAAIAKLAKDSGIDIYDIDDDAASNYKQEFQPEFATEVDNVAQDIIEDTALHTEFQEVAKTIPQDFMAHIGTNAEALKNFASHVKSGLAQKVIPEAIKQQMLHGGTFLDNYSKIGQEMSNQDAPPEKSKTKRKENPRADKLRERAKNHKGSGKGTKTKITGDDVWNMSSEDFNKQYM